MNLANHAYGGATSNNELSPASSNNITIPSYHDQVSTWLSKNPNPLEYNLNNDLIQVEIGGNDILHRVAGLLTGAVDMNQFASQLASSIASDTQRLVSAGYKNIVIWNLPSVEKTPMVISMGAGVLVKPVVDAINAAVKSAVQSLQGVRVQDLNGLMGVALQPAVLAAMEITDSTDACYTTDAAGKVSICPDPDQHLFYDGIHPASRMHYLWGTVAAVLARDSKATIDAAEALKLITTFNIGQSNRDNNIIDDGIAPSETIVLSSIATSTPIYPTSALPKCH
ncbi:hypothetical protein EV174_001795 [Coemansia sp. RSA 2320]|nr:hypothetical protein EV174_001795 [Coemansia sp. RSA 2320]